MLKEFNFKKLFLLPLLLSFVILSCQDEVTERVNNNLHDADFNATVEKAKAIFENESPDFPVIQTRSTEGVSKGIVFEPAWEEAFVAKHKDGSTTVETHVWLSQLFRMMPQESQEAYERTKDKRYLRHLSRVVVMMKNNGPTTHAFLMTIIGSKKYMEEHDFQLWKVSYGKIPKDFSGLILYHSLDGNFVNGWYVGENNQYKTSKPISSEDANLLTRAGTGCYTYQVTTYYIDCKDYTGYNYSTYEDEIYINPWAYTECGNPYPVVENYLVCDDTSTSGGGYTPPISGISKFVSSYPSELRDDLINFVSDINTKDCASQAVSNYITSLKNAYKPVKVEIDSTKAQIASYNPSENTVYFRSVAHFSSNTMLEEIIHSVQNVLYTPDEQKEAEFNIEFEAKLIIDYISLTKSSYIETDMARQIKNEKVILSDGSEKKMGEWLQGLKGEPFKFEDYIKFVGAWRGVSTGYNTTKMNERQHPKLIFPIIDLIKNSGQKCY